MLVPDQTISILTYILAKKRMQNTKKIKDMIKRQKEICKKDGIKRTHLEIF